MAKSSAAISTYKNRVAMFNKKKKTQKTKKKKKEKITHTTFHQEIYMHIFFDKQKVSHTSI